MLCPKCNGDNVRAIATVDNPDDQETYKRYKCYECQGYFYTVEFEAILNEQFAVAWATYFEHHQHEK